MKYKRHLGGQDQPSHLLVLKSTELSNTCLNNHWHFCLYVLNNVCQTPDVELLTVITRATQYNLEYPSIPFLFYVCILLGEKKSPI